MSLNSPTKMIRSAIYEHSQAATIENKYLGARQGNGGKSVTTLRPIEHFSPPKPVCGAFSKREIAPSEFRRYYDRGDLPIKVDVQGSANKVVWKISPE